MGRVEGEIAIRGIGTALPPHRLDQEDVTRRLGDALADRPDAIRWARRIFKQSGVETRYTCEPNLLEAAGLCRYVAGEGSEVPATSDRMRLYREASVPLAWKAAAEALQDGGVAPSEVTHLIAVSCTGMFLPGLDVLLTQQLGLRADVKRIPLTFLGCAAGLSGIRLARELSQGDPSAVILVVCVELCTLHIQSSAEREALYATAFFGDGASACLVGRATGNRRALFALGEGEPVLLPDSNGEMVWTVGDRGFDLILSPRIPALIGQSVPPLLRRNYSSALAEDALWAIHPGGRGIVDAIQQACGLTDAQTDASREVLRRYGNLSSATILFVLQELRHALDREAAGRREGIAVAFGPGVCAEFLPIAYLPLARQEAGASGRREAHV
ncbi:type III polyketide synthase [Cohnella nanjingensis]|uniref:Type III polyketide synthase n=1 Tax=Cohnella nanjingensis TaxID=1387779 RepID=A0A7X0RS98_9BACL|nr:type III polyketide synthase [Cohnella nanjingensis]MBB6672753.1 type III polyketide synthase [Cohnella nanjingensis]